ncbi:unnamed protein product (macronuclear) [Paramecium tetraurelia]|uniref:DDRGK domain-containing protein 1 n=1 Tax=Paramecium tetraurelia TaxID=5888 RepID=A0BRS7_PARTE|nr:uncharacterized protein GSPATT00031475001 [Paramecium tetraurelia]CAK61244.1 unnamed protein product [Paramecium tetraurelia]|eukprot:XP_001428642.1 hypothetical protein (macronuclear) [Paramecium tetraurelia strain d4-2]
MNFDIVFLLVSILVMGGSYYLLFVKKKGKAQTVVQQGQPQAQQGQVQQQQQQQGQQQQQQNQQRRQINRVEVESDDDSDRELDVQNAEQQAKREARKQKKQQQQQYVRQQIEMLEKKNEKRSKEYEEKERQREQQEQEEEEWRKKIEAEQKQKEQEEFDKWSSMFQVEQSGTMKLSAEEEEQKTKEFNERLANYIKLRKVVQLEEVSAELGISTTEVVDKIKQLEMLGSLNGLIDERGKYIHIRQNEIESLINYINARGRMTRSELLNESNRIIKLEPSKQDLQKIQEEEQKLLNDLQQELQQ